jgi:hypothetical protein
MSVITGINNGSLVEVMDQALQDLKTAENYITSKLNDGSNLQVQMANNRGFRIALDYTRNSSVGTPDPDGGTLTKTSKPPLDNMTANLQYIQFGQEISNLQLANSAPGMHVGPAAKAIAARKALQRRAEMEEYYFCRGAGKSTIAIPTTGVATTINVAGVLTCSGATDGLGGYLLSGGNGNNQYVRFVNSSYVFKHSGYITGKTSNTVLEYTPDVITTTGILTTDFILPDGTGSAGIKGLPYFINATGTMYDKTTVLALAATIDSSTTTFTRTAMEALYRNSKVRCGYNPKQRSVCSEAQMSNYYAQFYAQNSAQVHVVGGQRPDIDIGAGTSMDEYTFWGQKIDNYMFIHPANWWMLDYNTLTRLTLKQAGAMLTPAGDFVQKISGGDYANAQVRWDDDYIEFLSPQPFKNAGFTALAFSGLPGLLVNSNFTGS